MVNKLWNKASSLATLQDALFVTEATQMRLTKKLHIHSKNSILIPGLLGLTKTLVANAIPNIAKYNGEV